MAIESGNLLKELLKDENINFDFKERVFYIFVIQKKILIMD